MVSVRSLVRVVGFTGLLAATAFATESRTNNNIGVVDHLSNADSVDRIDTGVDEGLLRSIKGFNAGADRKLQEDDTSGPTPAPSMAATDDVGGSFTMSPTGMPEEPETTSTDSPTPAPSQLSEISGGWRPLPSALASAAAVAVVAVSGAAVMA